MKPETELQGIRPTVAAGNHKRTGVDVSIVVPMLNESGNAQAVCRELQELMERDFRSYEVIVVDDGSDDPTASEVEEAVGADHRFTLLQFARRFGQTAALSAGLNFAQGKVIVPLDGDGQNDPSDIPKLLTKLEGPPAYDVVSGWRKARKDKWLSRRMPSALANRLVRRLTWCHEIHDFGCSLKAYRREALSGVRIYGEMHRFLPALCKWRGARVTELVVNHRPRERGKTKYGLKRTVKVLLDLLTVKFLGDYLTKPLYFFGKLAALGLLTSLFSGGVALLQKSGFLTEHGEPVMLNDNIFVLFGMMTLLMSVMLVMMGVISELLVRIYHESQGREAYKIRRIVNGHGDHPFPGR